MLSKVGFPGFGVWNGEASQGHPRAQLVLSRLYLGGESLFRGAPAGGGLLSLWELHWGPRGPSDGALRLVSGRIVIQKHRSPLLTVSTSICAARDT